MISFYSLEFLHLTTAEKKKSVIYMKTEMLRASTTANAMPAYYRILKYTVKVMIVGDHYQKCSARHSMN